MIRPFDLRDFALIRRLSEQGTPLYTESALVDGLHPLRSALLGIVGGDTTTYVWKGDESNATGFIQLQLEANEHHAHILYLGTTNGRDSSNGNGHGPDIYDNGWLQLLDKAVTEVGRRGLHSLVAEVNETGSELPILRRGGFAVYTRQDIWVMNENDTHADTNQDLLTLRHSPVDDWEIQLLYANIVPRLVQLVEPEPPLYHGQTWVLREKQEVTAFAHIHTGSEATWLRLFIHPNAEALVDAIVQAALTVVRQNSQQPVFCCVRRYQSWLQTALQEAKFVHWASQAVMVKHTVHHAQKPATELKAVLDTQGMTPSAPIVQRYEFAQKRGG